jgi:hypothetical protein
MLTTIAIAASWLSVALIYFMALTDYRARS